MRPFEYFETFLKRLLSCRSGVEYYKLAVSRAKRPRPDVLRLLLEHEPEIAKHKDDQGYLLLHRAIRAKASVEVIRLILDANPQGGI